MNNINPTYPSKFGWANQLTWGRNLWWHH